ncbi:MAG: hypothetical protein KIS66_05360 [Fimbriimonadaceae bacterium]|nr:hypothetical protein [Fimbriimonadaceae bacterium]
MRPRRLLPLFALALLGGCSGSEAPKPAEPPKSGESAASPAPAEPTASIEEPTPTGPDAVVLRLRFKPGETYGYVTKIAIEQTDLGPNSPVTVPGPHVLTMTTTVAAKVLGVEGTDAKVEERVSDAKVTGTGGFASQAAAVESQRKQGIRTIVFDSLGGVKSATLGIGGKQVSGKVPLIVTFPRHEVKVGDTWTGTMMIDPATVTVDYTVVKIAPDTVTLSAAMTGEGVTVPKPMEVVVDRATGRTRSMRGKMGLTQGGATGSITLDIAAK